MKRKDFYQIHSDFCKTLANPKRQQILDNLRQKEMTVKELMKATGIPQANLSQHLAILRTKGILTARREGIHVHYSLANEKVLKAFDLISEILQEALSTQSTTVNAGIERKS